MNVRFKFPAGGQVIRVPLTISIPDSKIITGLEEDEMVIIANNNLPITLGVEVLCDSILSIIKASDRVSIDIAIALEQIASALIIRAKDNIPAWTRIDAEITEAIGMVLRAYQTSPDLAIDLVGESVFENGMTITAPEAVQMLANISPEIAENAELILSSNNNVEIGPIREFLEQISNKMTIEHGARVTLIGDLDPQQTGVLDPDAIPDIIRTPLQPYLEVGILEDGEGELSLAIRASDDVQAIKTEPVVIAYLDPKQIGELDPDKVPDGRTV